MFREVKEAHGMADAGYHSVVSHWIADTERAGLRVHIPDQARWFLVPFDVDASFALGDCPVKNSGQDELERRQVTTHLQRVHRLLDGLLASPYYQQNEGRNHVIALMHFAFEPWRGVGA